MDDYEYGEATPQEGDVQDFLRREQEALGDDQFFDNQNQNNDGGFDGGFGSNDAGFDQAGGGFERADQGGFEQTDQGGFEQADQGGFEQADQGGFEQADQAFEQGDYDQGGFDSGYEAPPKEPEDQGTGVPEGETPYYQSQAQYVDPYSAITAMDSTPHAVSEWKKQQEKLLQEKDQKSEEKNKKSLEEAKAALQQFYAEYNAKTQEKKKKNRNEQELFLKHRDAKDGGKVWETINELVDLTTKGQKSTRDVSRMRTIFVQLKTAPKAPGA